MSDDRASLEQLVRLRAAFPADQINKLPKPLKKDSEKGRCTECQGWHGLPAVHIDYVGHAELTTRLLDVDPWWNWEPAAWTEDGEPKINVRGNTARMWIKLTVAGVTRLGVGTCSANKDDVEKELIGDALRSPPCASVLLLICGASQNAIGMTLIAQRQSEGALRRSQRQLKQTSQRANPLTT
jgi:hypothetical protein